MSDIRTDASPFLYVMPSVDIWLNKYHAIPEELDYIACLVRRINGFCSAIQ